MRKLRHFSTITQSASSQKKISITKFSREIQKSSECLPFLVPSYFHMKEQELKEEEKHLPNSDFSNWPFFWTEIVVILFKLHVRHSISIYTPLPASSPPDLHPISLSTSIVAFSTSPLSFSTFYCQ